MPEAVVIRLEPKGDPPPKQRAHDPAALRTVGLTFVAGGNAVVDGIDLKLDPSSLTVILGPNGAGKSLFLRLVHGLIAPTSGTVLWGSEPVGEKTRKRQTMVFQKPVLLRRSVAANVDYVLGRGHAARRDELLATVGLLSLSAQPARLLSGGEQQRLALARALAADPAILLLDEATANLDPASVAMIESVLRRIHGSGAKIVMVTHDIGQAKRLADDVVFMHRGQVTDHMAARDFFAKPSSKAAKAYLDGEIVF